MSQFDRFTDQQRKHLVHIYAALQECIRDELEYEFEGFAPLDGATQEAAYELIHDQLAALMLAAHAGEARMLGAAATEAARQTHVYYAQRPEHAGFVAWLRERGFQMHPRPRAEEED